MVKRRFPIPRLRIVFGKNAAFGPGKAELLQAIDEFGSIAAAGRKLHMSYRRAWLLTADLNKLFREPLIATKKGGKYGGGAHLTIVGKDVLKGYNRMENIAYNSMHTELEALHKLRSKQKRNF